MRTAQSPGRVTAQAARCVLRKEDAYCAKDAGEGFAYAPGAGPARPGAVLSAVPVTLLIMDQSFDARGKAATDGIDARGIPADGGIDARGTDGLPAAPDCPQCGTPLRASGPGRRPVYCSRSCSSKAYRKRRTEDHQDAVADALVSSRVETPDPAAADDAGARELLELAAAVQRATAHYLHHLEQARHGQGDDPRCNRALQQLETSTTGVTQRLLRQAHVLRYEMTSARLRAERATAGTAPAALPTGPGINLVTTRVETPHPRTGAVPQGLPTPDPTVPGRSDAVPAPWSGISPPRRNPRLDCQP